MGRNEFRLDASLCLFSNLLMVFRDHILMCAQHVYGTPISFERRKRRRRKMPSHPQIIVNIYRFCAEMCYSQYVRFVYMFLNLFNQARKPTEIVMIRKIACLCVGVWCTVYTTNYFIYCYRLRPKKEKKKKKRMSILHATAQSPPTAAASIRGCTMKLLCVHFSPSPPPPPSMCVSVYVCSTTLVLVSVVDSALIRKW